MTVRFTSVDDAEAREVHAIVVDEVRKVAQVEQAWPACVRAGRSVPLELGS